MRFELLGELGRGGMGTVFKALDRETGDIVALKELKPELRPHNDFFKRELLLARKVTHINVCRVFDLFRDEDRVFISMEYVDGESLADVIKRSGAMPVDQTMEIARQIIDGLEAAHRRRVIHRDLKPANIMIARDGTVKIMDFGLARSLEQTARVGGSIAGTPAYMAPEQLNGELADARSDIYTLGVDIYE
ncbi:MAG TPA: serine/threonine-protein kinase, partial [Terriglobia bacterium]|nr:serine/threonine-protein kinase [Terriglobia bacterium]